MPWLVYIGFARLTFSLPRTGSLKGKRAIINKLMERTRSRFNAATAEVGDNDHQTRAILGFSVVSNNRSHATRVLEQVVDFARGATEAQLVDTWADVLSTEELSALEEPTLADVEGLKRDWDEDADERRKQARLAELRRGRDR